MSNSIEEIKNEVAQKHGFRDWDQCLEMVNPINIHIDEAIKLYHTCQLGEAVKELPDEQAWRAWVDKFKGIHGEIPNALEAFEWMRSEASLLLASHKSEYQVLLLMSNCVEEEMKNEITQLKEEIERMRISRECICNCGNKQDVISTVYPLYDICNYCRKAILK